MNLSGILRFQLTVDIFRSFCTKHSTEIFSSYIVALNLFVKIAIAHHETFATEFFVHNLYTILIAFFCSKAKGIKSYRILFNIMVRVVKRIDWTPISKCCTFCFPTLQNFFTKFVGPHRFFEENLQSAE